MYLLADGETRFIQQVCYELFRNCEPKQTIDQAFMAEMIKRVISKKTYNAQLLNRYTTAQQNGLKLIAITDGYNLYSKPLLEKAQLTKATLQSAVRSLLKEGIIFKERSGQLVFEDVEFKLWLRFDSTE